MKILLILFAFILMQGCAHQDEWSSRDTKFQIVAALVVAADGYTTSKIHKTPGVYEAGLIAGKVIGLQPSTSDVWMYTGTIMISSYFISRALPAKWRPFFQTFQIVEHGMAVISNCQLDLGC